MNQDSLQARTIIKLREERQREEDARAKRHELAELVAELTSLDRCFQRDGAGVWRQGACY